MRNKLRNGRYIDANVLPPVQTADTDVAHTRRSPGRRRCLKHPSFARVAEYSLQTDGDHIYVSRVFGIA